VDALEVPLHTTIDGQDVTGQEQHLVAAPTPEETARYGRLASDRLCGNCKFFNLEAGQIEARKQRFWARIRHEHGWSGRDRWTGPVPNYGICEWYGDAMVFMFASADESAPGKGDGCGYWRPGYGKIMRSFVRGLVGG
jgi:hypothetical protein